VSTSPIVLTARRAALVATLVVGAFAASAPAAESDLHHARAHPARWLVSLGDSLAASVQPNGPLPFNETDRGYAEQLLALLRTREPDVQLKKLGCGGESLRSMISGSLRPADGASCGPPEVYAARYRQGTQLAEAEAFLRAHHGQIAAVTVALGANDISDCVGAADVACVKARLPEAGERLAYILRTLRRAGARLIVGLTYYNPVLGAWGNGPEGQAFARVTNEALLATDELLSGVYHTTGARVADVAEAFRITDFETHGAAEPLNVTLACRWTWFCTPPPLGPDVHPNDEGYGVIARVIAQQIQRGPS